MERKRNNDTVTIPRDKYEELLSQIDLLTEKLRLANTKLFSRSSEKRSEISEGQLSLFNEAELIQDAEDNTASDEGNEGKVTVAAHTKRKSGSINDVIPEGLPTEVIEHKLTEEERICSVCGTVMKEIGKNIRRTLVIIPAQVKVREEWFYTYACGKCNSEGTETPIAETPRTETVIAGSYASPEAIAYIMTQKFVTCSPLYRQEQEFKRSGIELSRQTMSNWTLKASMLWLKPVYDELHRRLVARQILHADETTLQVLHEDGKASQSKSYMWLYRTGTDTDKPIVLYEYSPNRKPENAMVFLKGFTGYLHTDGYQGYHNLPQGITVVGCMAHMRRKFIEALEAIPEKERKTSMAQIGLGYVSKLYDIEKQIKEMPAEERYKQRQQRSKPVLEALLAWSGTVRTASKSALGKALYYLAGQYRYLVRYLDDGRLEIDNNLAERSIKPFVMSRKNFLFANTPSGAESSAVVFSLIQTALECRLDPYRYLSYVMTTAPGLDLSAEDWVYSLLPENAPDYCKSMKRDV